MILLLLLAAQMAPLPVLPLAGACQHVDNTYLCAQAVEAAQIPRSAARVRRVDSVLTLRLSTGSWIPIANDSAFAYTYMGYLRRPDYFVLYAQGDEWSQVRVVNARTGWSTLVDDVPVPSPDGKRVLTASHALEMASSPNRVALWQVAGDTLALEWSEEPNDWGPADPRWLSPSSFQIVRLRVGDERVVPVDTVIGRINHGRWTLRPRR